MRYTIALLCLVATINLHAQQLGMKNNIDEQWLLDRYSILENVGDNNLFTTYKNINSKEVYSWLKNINTEDVADKVSRYNLASLALKTQLWDTSMDDKIFSKRKILKYFYTTPNNFIEAQNNDYFFAINPVINYQQFLEFGKTGNTNINSRGFEIKGHIKNRLSAYLQLTDNQERGPEYVRNFIKSREAVPSAGYIKTFKGDGVDYSLASGYVSYAAIKNYVDVSFGHDRHFIGDGYRSMFLSDFGNNNLFFKINTKFWKLRYQNLFMELYPTRRLGADMLLPRKYTAMHHLSFSILPNWQLGFFEAVMFSRKDRFDFQYLNPVIFYRTIEQMNGSPDNALLGFDTKLNAFKTVQVYSQFLLDEFNFAELRKQQNYWGSKYAWQVGLKYINVAKIKNLDLQVERNYIRPFMYTYKDSLADYSSYNNALAHPNGANLIEHIAILKYQPRYNIYLSASFINRVQGMDTMLTGNNGGDILRSYNLRTAEYGFNTTGGVPLTTNYLNLNISYEFKPNIYIDAGFNYRNATSTVVNLNNKMSGAYLGVRMNSNRRLYDY
jgi:hypothetical protein